MLLFLTFKKKQYVFRQFHFTFCKTVPSGFFSSVAWLQITFFKKSSRFFSYKVQQKATLEYGNLIYPNKKSLSILLNCSNRAKFVRFVPAKPRIFLAFDWPIYARFADIRICNSPSTRPCFSFSLLSNYPLTSASWKYSGTNSFFQSCTKQLWQSVS